MTNTMEKHQQNRLLICTPIATFLGLLVWGGVRVGLRERPWEGAPAQAAKPLPSLLRCEGPVSAGVPLHPNPKIQTAWSILVGIA